MLIVAFKPGHDGGMAAIRDGRLLYSLESEKDSYARYSFLTPTTMLEIAERLNEMPDVVAVGGWQEKGISIKGQVGAGYHGTNEVITRTSRFFGKQVTFFTSSHERSHILGVIGMAPPRRRHCHQAVLVWEGITGAFFLVDDQHRVVKSVEVMDQPGAKYAALFAILDPVFPARDGYPRLSDAGKLMALAAYAKAADADAEIHAAVDRVLKIANAYPVPKEDFRDTVLFDAGVTSAIGTAAAALITEKIFTTFAEAAVRELPSGLPLRISGGCGLNCDWNHQWRQLGHFSEVFVPPCPNDSGSAIGTAIDAQATLTGSPSIDWSVYSGLDFVHDTAPESTHWRHRLLDHHALAQALATGRVVAWVQGRWEIGPRALGNRSLLADAQAAASKDRLNAIKQREDYRPIAPAARIEDLAVAFDTDFEDPYMLYFRRVRDRRLAAVTHVDGSARVQTVSHRTNQPLHQLLGAVAARQGLGVLCNTSLNFNGHGFINRMSDLVAYCEARGVTDMVVGEDWYEDTRHLAAGATS
ncbi:MAG: 3-hydroxymethylcephem carbamoyltransferase [Streptomycetaceae bacterium]|nr:3-hydroxymethylcephem carbamoyltransferase [Streptomycetaceae bacterium]